MQFDNSNDVTKAVTNNNKCNLIFDKGVELADTGKVKALINEKKIPDCSKIKNNDIISLNLEKINGCEMSLTPSKSVSFTDENFILELVEYDNKENKISAKCDTKGDNIKNITCKIGDKVNNSYTFKEKTISLSDKYLLISTQEEKDKFQIACNNKSSNKKNYLVYLIIAAVIIIIVVITVIIVICKKRKEKSKYQKCN